ncbi:MAG TPA: hypothetical protein VM577_18685 [Anaerovoracaceae bacterium]|nr:hypothetical protein [Anaerovoracaceae bacterium]
MCILCGDLERTDTKHLENVIHGLSNRELDDSLRAVKKQLNNAQILDAPPEIFKNLRKTTLVLMVEQVKRKDLHGVAHGA